MLSLRIPTYGVFYVRGEKGKHCPFSGLLVGDKELKNKKTKEKQKATKEGNGIF